MTLPRLEGRGEFVQTHHLPGGVATGKITGGNNEMHLGKDFGVQPSHEIEYIGVTQEGLAYRVKAGGMLLEVTLSPSEANKIVSGLPNRNENKQ